LEVVVSLDGDRFGVLLPAQRGLLAGGDRWEDAIELPSFNNSWDQHSEVKLRVRYQSVLGNEFRMTHIYPQAGDTTFVAEWRRSVDQDWTSLTLANP
jgi:hypothetical protein